MSRERSIAALILAAGGSRRLGQPKQLLAFQGTPLVRLAVERARESRCDAVFVVVGAYREPVLAALAGLEIEPVDNPSWERGMGSSIRAGVRALADRPHSYTAVLMMSVDQYGVSAGHLDRLCESYDAGHDVVASGYAGTVGIPALFGRSSFPALLAIGEAHGAQTILREGYTPVFSVSCPEASLDLDTKADLERFNRRTSA